MLKCFFLFFIISMIIQTKTDLFLSFTVFQMCYSGAKSFVPVSIWAGSPI